MITVLFFIPDAMIQAYITIMSTKCYYCHCRFREALSSFQCHIWQSSNLYRCLLSIKALDAKHYVATSPRKWAASEIREGRRAGSRERVSSPSSLQSDSGVSVRCFCLFVLPLIYYHVKLVGSQESVGKAEIVPVVLRIFFWYHLEEGLVRNRCSIHDKQSPFPVEFLYPSRIPISKFGA